MSDITIAASEAAFEQLFIALRDNFTYSKSDNGTFGPLSASYSLALHLEGGTLQLNNDNTITVSVMDIVFDSLALQLCFNLPSWGIPAFCIVPDPWNGCLVGFPGITIGGPICIGPDLSGLVSEINEFKASLLPKYFVDPGRLPAWTDLDAEFAGKSNMWQIYIDPEVSIDLIDVPATIANIIEDLVEDAITNLLPSWLPDWAINWIWTLVGPILDVVITALGILDSIEDFIQDLLGNSFDLLDIMATAIADYFASKEPVYEFEDPYPIITGGGLIPVKIPIRKLGVSVNTDEMIITANVG